MKSFHRNLTTIAGNLRRHGSATSPKIMPEAKGLPGIGTIFSIIAAGGPSKLHLYVDRRHKELGPIYREKIGPVPGVFISDGDYMRKIYSLEGKYPKHIIPEAWLIYNEINDCKRGLLFMEGEEWVKFRKILNNIILKPKTDDLIRAVDTASEDLVGKWSQGGRVLNLEQNLYTWSLEVIMAILLGADDYRGNKKSLSRLINQLSCSVRQIFKESSALSMIPAKLAVKFQLPVWKRFVNSTNTAIETGKEMVCCLSNMAAKSPNNNGLLMQMKETGMKDEDVDRIITDLILAAGDTTAYTTQWLLHLLSIHSDTQEEILNELKNVKENEIPNCNLLKGALRESLRLYPVAPFITRYMPDDTSIDGYQINKGELVFMDLYSSGRNDTYFHNPEEFLPQRWCRDEKGYKGVSNPSASMPFAMGSRSCIGKKIAETQILVTISKILRKYKITSTTKDKINITLQLVAVPKKPIDITLSKRH